MPRHWFSPNKTETEKCKPIRDPSRLLFRGKTHISVSDFAARRIWGWKQFIDEIRNKTPKKDHKNTRTAKRTRNQDTGDTNNDGRKAQEKEAGWRSPCQRGGEKAGLFLAGGRAGPHPGACDDRGHKRRTEVEALRLLQHHPRAIFEPFR